jgi:hypothetical protein
MLATQATWLESETDQLVDQTQLDEFILAIIEAEYPPDDLERETYETTESRG